MTTAIFVKTSSGRGFDLGIGGTSLGRKREPIPLLFIMNSKLALLNEDTSYEQTDCTLD